MVANAYQRSLAEVEIYRAGSIGQDGGLNSHLPQHSHGIHNVLHGVPFVEMHTPLHGCDGNFIHFPDHKPPGVSFDRWLGKSGDFFVGNAS